MKICLDVRTIDGNNAWTFFVRITMLRTICFSFESTKQCAFECLLSTIDFISRVLNNFNNLRDGVKIQLLVIPMVYIHNVPS